MTPEQYLATVDQATTAQVAEGTGASRQRARVELWQLHKRHKLAVSTGHLNDAGKLCNCIEGFDRPAVRMWRRTP